MLQLFVNLIHKAIYQLAQIMRYSDKNVKYIFIVLCALLSVSAPLFANTHNPPNSPDSYQDSESLSQKLHNPSNTTNSYKLDSVVTTAGGFAQSLLLAPASISVVKPEEILTRPVRDIAEAISLVPGVDIDNGVGKTGGYGISIRGMGQAYTLILIDGKRVDGSAQGAIFPNGFGESLTSFMPPIAAIERIEVIRGPASTLYGSDAIGGVVNIITKKNFNKWGATVTYDYTLQELKQFGNSQSASFYVAGPLTQSKNWGIILRGRQYTRDYVPTINLELFRTASGTAQNAVRNTIVGLAYGKIYNIGTRLLWSDGKDSKEATWDNSKHSAYIDLDFGQQIYDNSQGLLGTYNKNGSIQPPEAQSGYTDVYNVYRGNIIANHDGIFLEKEDGVLRKLSVNNSIQYNITANPNRYITNDSIPAANRVTGINGFKPGDSREITNHDFIADHKTNIFFGFGERFGAKTSFGARYWLNIFKDNIIQASGGEAQLYQHIGALFGESEFALWDSLFITVGARGNFNSIFGANISPRLYLSYNAIDEWLTLKGGVSTGYKTPALSNLVSGITGLTRQGQVPIYGNPNLKPESSINYEFSILSDNDYINTSITGFFTDFNDKIISTGNISKGQVIPEINIVCADSFMFGCQSNINAQRAISYGVEVYGALKPINVGYGDITFNVSYTLNQTKIIEGRTGRGQQLTDVPLHNLNAAFFYNTKYFGVFLRGEFKAGHHRGLYRTASGTADVDKQIATLGEFFKPYYLVHLGFNANIIKGLRANFGIYNLLNFNFIDYVAVSGLGNNNATTTFYNNYNYIREGRRYYLSLSYEF
ncbi:TonB-dependent receptor [Helicobacter aurati]|uniref:TonB-dependent receptor n=1 Tax=Helicobacter aurati TaxID=137778 RepID=A0A3D8J905_9HELI|nr:TonB-dependent receptor [Helicobacter aurati]RDU73770.1 TonB-dependent receptor [Helicobacter aurati]